MSTVNSEVSLLPPLKTYCSTPTVDFMSLLLRSNIGVSVMPKHAVFEALPDLVCLQVLSWFVLQFICVKIKNVKGVVLTVCALELQ